MPKGFWHASAYYESGVIKDGKDVSGQFAIEVWATSREDLQMDLDVFEEREDIGTVRIWKSTN